MVGFIRQSTYAFRNVNLTARVLLLVAAWIGSATLAQVSSQSSTNDIPPPARWVHHLCGATFSHRSGVVLDLR